MSPADVPVFVLCGGLGTRLKEETEFRPKPMVPIGGRPMLWHIVRLYHHYGFKRFVLCLGFKAEVIKDYFLNFYRANSDFTVDLTSNAVTTHCVNHDLQATITLAYTGEANMTGSRLAQATARYLGDAAHFAVSYGDGLTDADLAVELEAHIAGGCVGTVLGVNPPSRFGEFSVGDDSRARGFSEKPVISDHWINGGFFLFSRRFLEFLNEAPDCVMERQPLATLAEHGELNVFRHRGFWACMDTQRDREYLEGLWASGRAPWRVWDRD